MSGRSVVVLRALGLGDFLTGVPAYRALADAYPEHGLVLAAPRAIEPLARRCGAVHAVAHTPGLVPLDASLRAPDVAVDLHGSGPASHSLVAALGPRRLVTFTTARTAAFAQGPRWRRDEHEVSRWCRLLQESGIPADPHRLDLDTRGLRAPAWAADATLIHPGAAYASRRWPPGRFAAVAAVEAAHGRRVVVTAGPGEEALAASVAAGARAHAARFGGIPSDAVRTVAPADVGELAAIVAAAGRLVCGDTGVAHLATAVRTPSVVLFGPVSPSLWGPPAERGWHVALWAGGHGDPHGAVVDPGLLEIDVPDVLLALARLPHSAPAASDLAAHHPCAARSRHPGCTRASGARPGPAPFRPGFDRTRWRRK